ncbi:uncharacterized protein LOC118561624 isoform X2 [Fundulus heteroclitus]|uniref:uncharacterized protein LOC118561624 isoform X1 n=1 Tax=Fundulus heteroclitus TaxID=8078 RepID=UPI00165C0583|nr:uncharacterized protein LOC118561624 isoform X1 [Fundulus heteroclitus]XP_035989753.1 uncharacterized protein LOC118561624 isoform X2 [Fundulus heteroclitus]
MASCSGGCSEDENMDTGWSMIENRRGGGGKDKGKKGINAGKRSLEDEEERVEIKKKIMMEDFKVILKFKAGQDMIGISPINLSNGLKKVIGDVELAKVLRDGSLLIICKNAEQKNKAVKPQMVCKKEVLERKVVGEERGVKGVISGIPVGENLEELKKVMKGGEIIGIKRLQAFRNGEKMDSTSILLDFKDKILPDKVMVGYMSFNVRAYIPPPLRCYKCQRYGHTANVCKGKQRCGRCGGEHSYGECGNNPVKCCNCGGNHTAAYAGCMVRKEAAEIQKVKIDKRITYAEAVKEVKNIGNDPKTNYGKNS